MYFRPLCYGSVLCTFYYGSVTEQSRNSQVGSLASMALHGLLPVNNERIFRFANIYIYIFRTQIKV